MTGQNQFDSFDELDQQMLELVYDLMPADQAAELQQRIAAEPAAAEAFERAQRMVGVFSAAARWREAPIDVAAMQSAADVMRKGECGTRNGAAHAVLTTKTHIVPSAFQISNSALAQDHLATLRRALQWVIGIAATVLFAFLLGGYVHHRGKLSAVAQRHLRVTVTGPSQLASGADNKFSISTSNVLGEPQSVNLQFTLYDLAGKKLFADAACSDANGLASFTCSTTAALPSVARLEVLAFQQDETYRLETTAPVSPHRFLTRLSTDKPLYRPGEVVRFRSLTLGRFGLDTPADLPVHFEILDPSGAVVAGSQQQGITERGVGNGEYPIPPDGAGGEYRLVARSLNNVFPEERRKFFVREYRAPQLKKELEFVRDSYSPGQRVAADLAVSKAQGEPAAGAQLTITASVDGQVVHQATDKASALGTYRVEFALPESIERGAAQLAIQCDDGGVRETIAKTIPVNLGKVDLYLCPEGGDLVAGLQNRVYFAAKTPLGKPVHVEGSVVASSGEEVARIATEHKGMGAFTFTPVKGSAYEVRLTSPANVTSASKLPEIAENGTVVLSARPGVFESGAPIAATLTSTKAGMPLLLAAYCRGVQVGQQVITTKAGRNEISLAVLPEAAGVTRLTVYDLGKHQPEAAPRAIAERLVYRKPDRRLQVGVAEHAQEFSPGQTVELSVWALNESGQPAKSAAIGCAVVDDSLLNLADDDTAAMPTYFYLTSEVEKPEDLEKADFYLSDDPRADRALDLLLGTQGWRRFVERELEALQQKTNEAGQPVKPQPTVERLLALGGATLPPTVLDNLDDVRAQFDRARAAAVTDYRSSATQLSRVAIFGGLVLGGLLLAINVIPYLRRQQHWSWRTVLRRLAPAAVAAGVCLVAGLLWNPAGLDLPKSNLVAMQEFKLRTVALPNPTGEATVAFANESYDMDGDGQNHRWFAARQRWGDFYFGEQLGGPHEFAYFDRFDVRSKLALQLGVRLYDDDAADYVPFAALDGVQWKFLDLQVADRLTLESFAMNDRRAHLAYGYRQDPFRLGANAAFGGAAGAEFDAYVKLFKQRAEQFRFAVRQYAHQHVASGDGVRRDFAETLYWHPLLITDENGRASVKFDLADSITSYRVMIDAHDGQGRIGFGDGQVKSRLPFAVEPKLPLEVNAGDRIELAVAVSNDSSAVLEADLGCTIGNDAIVAADGTRSVTATRDLLKLVGAAEQKLTVAPLGNTRTHFTLDVVGQQGTADVEVRGAAAEFRDAKRQTVKVVPAGFPVGESYAGRIDGQQQVTIDLPESVIPGTLEVTLAAYPSTLATLESGLEGILREPSGCFEQASSSNYPNLLLLRYLDEHDVGRPELTRRGKELLSAGYAKLTGYECKNGGFEWFGADPGHEALTAYGLMQFRDMAHVHEVDPALLRRTADWLLSRRDGHGGFQLNDKKLDGFGSAPVQISNAYIVWALSESGQQGIEAELNRTIEHARGSDDSYEVALAAAAAVNAQRQNDGRELLGKLVAMQDADGKLTGKHGSITRSGGRALSIETTALAALAWLKLPEFRQHANRAMDWIVRNRSGGGDFGSTQATILALKALVEHAKVNHGSVAGGELIVKHGDRVIGTQQFAANEIHTIKLAGLEGQLTPGENKLTISLTGENQMPYTIDVGYRAQQPQSDPACAVELSTRLASTTVKAGDSVGLEAILVNRTDQGQPMTVAILGLPAGLQPRPDQLDELKKAGTIDYYETRGREVICYWRSLAPNKRVPLRLDLVAEWAGKYTGPASRAYLYYTAEQKHWSEPLAIEIAR